VEAGWVFCPTTVQNLKTFSLPSHNMKKQNKNKNKKTPANPHNQEAGNRECLAFLLSKYDSSVDQLIN